ncbi:hypothetical protein OHA33_18850 [Streptomyces sp. NBC_00562]|uniref:hypothetical protein n=1 Tax=Streptomyces sp. NBC_00562 TaxID=2975777 RepID=UPI002E7FB8EC|nr:hypothetical protein [Streptomyces sp. NBC_00562]WUC20761.1 hypothetical protein OHA33_18850 [Streptomyces sp. NBC_00562]
MSVNLTPWVLSNPRARFVVVTVIVVVILAWPTQMAVIGAYADAAALITLLTAATGATARIQGLRLRRP